MSRALRRGLEQEGYAVDTALDGPDGLHRATARPSPAPSRALAPTSTCNSLGDPNQIQRFWDARIGVYSDNPFPPLSGTATLQQEQEQLIMPNFPEGVIPA